MKCEPERAQLDIEIPSWACGWVGGTLSLYTWNNKNLPIKNFCKTLNAEVNNSIYSKSPFQGELSFSSPTTAWAQQCSWITSATCTAGTIGLKTWTDGLGGHLALPATAAWCVEGSFHVPSSSGRQDRMPARQLSHVQGSPAGTNDADRPTREAAPWCSPKAWGRYLHGNGILDGREKHYFRVKWMGKYEENELNLQQQIDFLCERCFFSGNKSCSKEFHSFFSTAAAS